MDAKRDEGEVAKLLHFEEVILRRRLYFIILSAASGRLPKISIFSKRWVVAKGLHFAVVFLERLFCLTSAGLERVL